MYHHFSAYFVMSSVAARFFPPQVGRRGRHRRQTGGVPFRIDHDEKFNQTTHLQYQIGKRGPWAGGTGATTPAWSPEQYPSQPTPQRLST